MKNKTNVATRHEDHIEYGMEIGMDSLFSALKMKIMERLVFITKKIRMISC